MANLIRKKLAGILTAAAVCMSCLPLGCISASATSIDQLDEAISNAPRSDFMGLAFYALITSSYSSAGYETGLISEENYDMLDNDNSGIVDINDAYTFLYWSSWESATGTLLSAAEQFLAEWEVGKPIVTNEGIATTTESELTETTTSTTITQTTVTQPTTTTTAPTTAPTTTTTAVPTTTTTTTTTSTTKATTKATTVTTTTTTKATTTIATKSVYNGIDVSKYQGNINWTAVRNAGNDFALIRAGYGKYASQEDPYFDQNMKNAQAAGISCGAYWFSYAESVADAKQEAEVFAQVISGYKFEYPLVFDIEAQVHTKMTKEEVSAIITAFCDTMEAKGYYVTLYSYASFLNTYVYQSVLEKYDIWVAHFNVSSPAYTKTAYGMWQYSSTGTVSGVPAAVDLDYSYKCYPNLMAQYKLNGF